MLLFTHVGSVKMKQNNDVRLQIVRLLNVLINAGLQVKVNLVCCVNMSLFLL